MRTTQGSEGAAQFMLYPMEDDESELEFEFDLLVREAQANACNVCAGGWVRFSPTRVEIAGWPEQGFAVDATRWRRYKLINKGFKPAVFVDGEKKLEAPTQGIYKGEAQFGNRPGIRIPAKDGRADTRKPLRGLQYEGNAGVFFWREFSARIRNRRDHSINWTWNASQGYPGQFARDRLVLLERNGSFAAGDSGYSSWDQLADGTAVVVDYTCGYPARPHPLLRAYKLDPEAIP